MIGKIVKGFKIGDGDGQTSLSGPEYAVLEAGRYF